MLEKRINYPAKVMLAGEYGVIVGGSALTLPLNRFSTWPVRLDDIKTSNSEKARVSNHSFRKICRYIASLPGESFNAQPDLNLMQEMSDELWYDSSIPDGYGIGSSGALTACIYRQFFKETELQDLNGQRNDLALIESYFHGKSSGVDALTCYRKTPLFFREDGSIEEVILDPLKLPYGYRFFLLDSSTTFETGPLVKHFLKKMEDSSYASLIREEYLPTILKFNESVLGLRDADPGLLFRVISDFQFTHFRRMIPDSILDIWIEGQVSNDFYLKLNGSGGGYILGICHHSAIDSLEHRFEDDLIWIE